jgi:hypothetical protein
MKFASDVLVLTSADGEKVRIVKAQIESWTKDASFQNNSDYATRIILISGDEHIVRETPEEIDTLLANNDEG